LKIENSRRVAERSIQTGRDSATRREFSMTFTFTIFLCFSNILSHLSNFSYLVCMSCKIFIRWRFYLFLKSENSRRVVESRSVCVGLNNYILFKVNHVLRYNAQNCTEQVNVEINYLHLEETWRLSPMHILPTPWISKSHRNFARDTIIWLQRRLAEELPRIQCNI
jgi:hypothetical protein